MRYASKAPGRTLLLGLLLWLLTACADTGPADDVSATLPALQPVPSHTAAILASQSAVLPLATDTPAIIRPPTGTPTPIQADQQIPTATPIPADPSSLLATPGTIIVTVPANNSERQATPEARPLAEGLDCEAEIVAYKEHLASDPVLATYEAQVIAACYVEQGDRPAAIEVYRAAVEDGADRITEVALRQSLAELLLEDGDYPAALAQYEAILDLAETEVTRSLTLYQAGQTELVAGNADAGYAHYLALVDDYPAAAQSYPALNELLAAGYPIDDYQQGLVAYNAQAYNAAAAAFLRSVDSNPIQDAYLYLAWSLEKLGDVDGALSQIDAYITATGSAFGRIERAKIQARAGRTQAALDDYQAYLAEFPDGDDAPLAAWQSAALSHTLGYLTLARDRYQAFVQAYPEHKDAAQALFRAGYLSWQLDETGDAQETWQQTVDVYPEKEYGAAALLWLLKVAPAGESGPLTQMAFDRAGASYYATRAGHLAGGIEPFAPAVSPELFRGDTGRDFAESWLRDYLGLPAGTPVAELSGQLAGDPRLAWAERLWEMGQWAEAGRQFELLRADYAADPLASYQLALHLRDLGLYKSSVLAALSLMSQAGVGASGAPRFIARLAYPAYYADLVLAGAQTYGYDPLLQLALIHGESYFDSRATSAAGARGLSQVLPETGDFIANQLSWPDYRGDDLYRPEVNIPFGAYFLDQQLDRYDGAIAAALAAYNAGPGFADDWHEAQSDDHDLFLETVDFPETQRYIKQIYDVHAIYRFLYG
ncbi:MAG TPA: transglycosylase SLT domain-containing protein [Anaerolineae bacterium]|nr:transglycosylase SLT domain-containing protein [Anaerolineae bacterium]